jgi:uncharacterized iron-regulated membrane protein
MSVTGVILTHEKQVNEWAYQSYRTEPPSPGAEHLPLGTMLEKASETRPDFRPSSLTFRPDPAEPVVLGMGRGRRLYANRHTGTKGTTKNNFPFWAAVASRLAALLGA